MNGCGFRRAAGSSLMGLAQFPFVPGLTRRANECRRRRRLDRGTQMVGNDGEYDELAIQKQSRGGCPGFLVHHLLGIDLVLRFPSDLNFQHFQTFTLTRFDSRDGEQVAPPPTPPKLHDKGQVLKLVL